MKCRICGNENLIMEQIEDIKTDVNRYYKSPVKLEKRNTLYGYCNRCQFGQIEYCLGDAFYSDYATMHVDSLTKGLDRGVSTYQESYYRNVLNKLSDMSCGRRMLDIGCGAGTLMEYARDYFIEVRGVEPSQTACEVGREKGFDIVNGFFDETWTDAGYDVITATQVMEHLEHPLEVINTMHEILEKGGLVYVDVPNGRKVYGDSHYYDVYLEHINYWSVASLTKAFCFGGFSIIESGEIHDANHIFLIAQKEQERHPFDDTRNRKRKAFYDLASEYKSVSVWGCGVKGSVFLRGIRTDKIRYFFDSDKRLEGLFIDDFGLPVSLPSKNRVNESDLIIITAIEHKDTIERLLREKYGFSGEIRAIDEL